MDYLDIIPLENAKTYLRIDDGMNEDDNQIIRMIKGSLSYIEQYTNVYLFARDKEYIVQDNFVKVYDYPINSEVTTIINKEVRILHTNYTVEGSTLVLNVGFDDVAKIPQELIEVAYAMIKSMYFEKENNKGVFDSLDSLSVMTLNQYKRFIL